MRLRLPTAFYAKTGRQPYVLRHNDKVMAQVYPALTHLLEYYFLRKDQPHWQSACKAYFLQILYWLTVRLQASEMLRSEFVQHREQANRLARLFEYVRLNYTERITVAQATQLVHLSPAQFMKVFKKVTGMTFIAYVTRVRIAAAARLLSETDLTIAEIATQTGFSDQSYFDRRFRQMMGKSPRDWRRARPYGPSPYQPNAA